MMSCQVARLGVLAAFAAVISGCAATTIQVPRMKPAKVNLGSIRKVAIGEIEGEGGRDLSDRLVQAILASGKYEVLDREHLAMIAREQNLAAGEAGAAGLGKVLGAAALVFGRISRSTYGEVVSANEGACYYNGASGPCTTYKRTGTHRMTVSMKIIEAASGKIITAPSINGEAGGSREAQVLASKTSDLAVIAQIVPPLENTSAYGEEAMNEVVGTFMRMIAPFQVMVPVVLYEQSNVPSSTAGITAAKAGNWTTAIQMFKDALETTASSPDLEVRARSHYNLGVALGYSGSYDEGLAEIQQAMSLKPDPEYQLQANEIRGFKADDAKLKAQEEAQAPQ